MNDSIVYVVQDPDGKEILPARKHGKLRVILNGRENSAEAVRELTKVLMNIRPQDLLLQIGSPRNIGIATHLALLYNHGKLNTLLWQRWDYDYTVETITTYDHITRDKPTDTSATHGQGIREDRQTNKQADRS